MEKNNQKNFYLIGGGVALLVIMIVAMFAFSRGKGEQATEPETATDEPAPRKNRLSAPINVIPLEQRPVVHLRPFSQSGGRFVSIEIQTLPLAATSAEYENVYNIIGASAVDKNGAATKVPDNEPQTGLDAFIGTLDVGSLPTSSENRFGSCSAGGACTNQEFDTGTLTITFDAAEKYAVSSDWTYFRAGKSESITNDGDFTLSSDALAKTADYLILGAMGLPEGVPGEVAITPDGGRDNGIRPIAYQIHFTKAPTNVTGTVTFKSTVGERVAVYDGKSWTAYDLDDELPIGDAYTYALLSTEEGVTQTIESAIDGAATPDEQ